MAEYTHGLQFSCLPMTALMAALPMHNVQQLSAQLPTHMRQGYMQWQ